MKRSPEDAFGPPRSGTSAMQIRPFYFRSSRPIVFANPCVGFLFLQKLVVLALMRSKSWCMQLQHRGWDRRTCVFVAVSRSTCVRLYLISLQCEESAEMRLQMDCIRVNINPVWLANSCQCDSAHSRCIWVEFCEAIVKLACLSCHFVLSFSFRFLATARLEVLIV